MVGGGGAAAAAANMEFIMPHLRFGYRKCIMLENWEILITSSNMDKSVVLRMVVMVMFVGSCVQTIRYFVAAIFWMWNRQKSHRHLFFQKNDTNHKIFIPNSQINHNFWLSIQEWFIRSLTQIFTLRFIAKFSETKLQCRCVNFFFQLFLFSTYTFHS